MTGRALDRDGPARLLRRDDAGRILAALALPGEETRLVGGCVRDALLGCDASDLDLATTLEPGAVLSLAGRAGLRAIPTGIEHGTVTILVKGTAFEVTTLREDIETDGRHAVVRFGRDFARDAERRDFTINALSLSADGTLHDTTDGLDDLAAGRVRFIGDAATRIAEDALRILRFFRFHARYGLGPPDDEGLAACIAAQAALTGLSRERVRAEILKILSTPGPVEVVVVMERAGILARLIGGPVEVERLARMVAALPNGTSLARLAALAVRSEADAMRLQDNLRLSKTEAAELSAYAAAQASLSRLSEVDLGAIRTLIACHEPAAIIGNLSALDARENPQFADEALAFLRAAESGEVARPVFPLAGADLVARGILPGPAVGRGLEAARTRWLDVGCPDDAEAIEDLTAVGLRSAEAQG